MPKNYFQIVMLLNFFRKFLALSLRVCYLCFTTETETMKALNHSNIVVINVINVLLVVNELITGER